MKNRSIIIVLTLFQLGLINASSAQQSIRPLPKSKNNPVVIAHRGSHLNKPENTIASIQEAIALGADYVEIDLRTTSDGELILWHNETIASDSDHKTNIKGLSLNSLIKIKLIAKDSSIHHVARFQQALEACRDKINIYLDFKAADPVKAYALIKTAHMEKQVLVYINRQEDYLAWRKTAPAMPLMSGLDPEISTKEALDTFMQSAPLEAVDRLPHQSLLPALNSAGVSVFLDVQQKIETPAQWQAALDKGVQGLQTDHPAALIEYLRKKKE